MATTDIILNQIIAERIKYLKQKQGLNIEKLAYQSGISKGGLSEIEGGGKEPRILTILKIIAGLNMSITEFFDFAEINNYLER